MLLAHGAFPICPQEIMILMSMVPGLAFVVRRVLSWWRGATRMKR